MTAKSAISSKGFSCLFLIFLLLPPLMSQSQICDDFSDGNFNSSPAWSGDTADFRINSNMQLRLYTDSAGSSQLFLPYSMPDSDTIEWRFWIRLGFTPTTNNYAIVALYSDSSDIKNATHSLTLAVTNPISSEKNITITQDGVHLFTFPYHPRLSNNKLRFLIRMIDRQQLTMSIDTIGETDSAYYTDCGTVALSTDAVPEQAFFSILCRYTSSRSKLFYFDDIGINADNCTNSGSEGGKLQMGDILINEILFNPVTGGADYVELYNNSGNTLSLEQIYLATVNDTSVKRLYPIPSEGAMEPHSLIVVTTDASFVSTHYTVSRPDWLIQTTNMPAYGDKSGTVVVATADSVVLDQFDYDVSMHSRLLRDVEGVALERRSFERSTQEASNWYSAASTAGYGTPTARNSQSRETLFLDNDFAFSTTLFSPDGDGYNDLLDITYNLQQCDLAANIIVFDRHGRQVRQIARGHLLGCQGALIWDGTNDNGTACPRGNYLVVVEAYNESGARQSWRRTVALVRK